MANGTLKLTFVTSMHSQHQKFNDDFLGNLKTQKKEVHREKYLPCQYKKG